VIIAMEITMTGRPVLSRPTERPVIMLVAWPVCEDEAIDYTGPK
jgi:hypothetical protein